MEPLHVFVAKLVVRPHQDAVIAFVELRGAPRPHAPLEATLRTRIKLACESTDSVGELCERARAAALAYFAGENP